MTVVLIPAKRENDFIGSSREIQLHAFKVASQLGEGYSCDMIIRAVVHKAEEGGFWAQVPALPGCATEGETMEELRANLREAIEAWLEAGSPPDAGNQEDQILELAI